MRPVRPATLLLLGALVPGALSAQRTREDSLDAFVKQAMEMRHVRGLSLAIIQGGKIVLAKGYGITDDSTKAPVTTATLFQAGSVSKPVSALGALHLVEAGRLSLDGNVNEKLTSWKVPDNRFTATEKVTLRRLLSHNAGLTVHGFPGYDVAEPVPTVVQVLDGAKPANTPAIRVDTTPGAIWRYSGGGFTVMQQMVMDVTGVPFPTFLQETVLRPIGMTASSFEQPQPPARARLTATGYYSDRSPVRGRWHVYPEMAAAGLWTTPTDLAKFAIEIQETLAGKGHGVISPGMARQYLTEQKDGSGLGIGVRDTGQRLWFSHGGRDEGFDTNLRAAATTGGGVVVMINANDNSSMMQRIDQYISRTWGLEGGAPPTAPAAVTGVRLDPVRLAEYPGYYEAAENQMVALAANAGGTGLQRLSDGLPDEELLAIDSTTFGSTWRPFRVGFALNGRGEAVAALFNFGTPRVRPVPRVAPLPSSLQAAPDPDAALTARISTVLAAIRQGGAAVAASPDLTPGAKADLGAGNNSVLAGVEALTYLGQEEVSGRSIRRHGGQVARVRIYRSGSAYLLIHLTADGLVTDYDVVPQ